VRVSGLFSLPLRLRSSRKRIPEAASPLASQRAGVGGNCPEIIAPRSKVNITVPFRPMAALPAVACE